MTEGDADVQCLKIRIVPGKTPAVLDFVRGLRERDKEVRNALAREEMYVESLFLDRTEDGDYLYFYARAADLEAANRAFERGETELDRDTRTWIRETWEEVVRLELLADLTLAAGTGT